MEAPGPGQRPIEIDDHDDLLVIFSRILEMAIPEDVTGWIDDALKPVLEQSSYTDDDSNIEKKIFARESKTCKTANQACSHIPSHVS